MIQHQLSPLVSAIVVLDPTSSLPFISIPQADALFLLLFPFPFFFKIMEKKYVNLNPPPPKKKKKSGGLVKAAIPSLY